MARFVLPGRNDLSCTERGPKPHFVSIELTEFGVAEEHAVHVLIHLFEPDLFVPKNFANKNPSLVPTDVSAVVHSPRLERSRILKSRYSAVRLA
jgi:hypothetical protein